MGTELQQSHGTFLAQIPIGMRTRRDKGSQKQRPIHFSAQPEKDGRYSLIILTRYCRFAG
jgi:hypothetical protein